MMPHSYYASLLQVYKKEKIGQIKIKSFKFKNTYNLVQITQNSNLLVWAQALAMKVFGSHGKYAFAWGGPWQRV